MGLKGLPPVEGDVARVLILGTMPGAESLKRRQYYAHARNAFWKVMERLGIDPSLPYVDRCEAVKQKGIALWDVLRACERDGSADARIRNPVANGLGAFARRHPELRAVLFNGRKARQLFDRLLEPQDGIDYATLPSSSPANAKAGKTAIWVRKLREALAERR